MSERGRALPKPMLLQHTKKIVTVKSSAPRSSLTQDETVKAAERFTLHGGSYLVPEPEASVSQVFLGRHRPWRGAAEALRQAVRPLPPP